MAVALCLRRVVEGIEGSMHLVEGAGGPHVGHRCKPAVEEAGWGLLERDPDAVAAVAAAAPPANPEPTTIILNFRLFAGLTNFEENR